MREGTGSFELYRISQKALSVLRLDRFRERGRLGRGGRVCIQMFKTRAWPMRHWRRFGRKSSRRASQGHLPPAGATVLTTSYRTSFSSCPTFRWLGGALELHHHELLGLVVAGAVDEAASGNVSTGEGLEVERAVILDVDRLGFGPGRAGEGGNGGNDEGVTCALKRVQASLISGGNGLPVSPTVRSRSSQEPRGSDPVLYRSCAVFGRPFQSGRGLRQNG